MKHIILFQLSCFVYVTMLGLEGILKEVICFLALDLWTYLLQVVSNSCLSLKSAAPRFINMMKIVVTSYTSMSIHCKTYLS